MSSLARAYSIALNGLEGTPVEVQTHIGPGIVGTTLVGLPDASLREAKERVRAALFSCGIPTLNRRVTVNLSPADLPKSGSAFDVTIAVSMLVARGILSAAVARDTAFYGELGLDGSLQPVPGALPAALAAQKAGFKRFVVPVGLVGEVSLVEGLEAIGLPHLDILLQAFDARRAPHDLEGNEGWEAVQDFTDEALRQEKLASPRSLMPALSSIPSQAADATVVAGNSAGPYGDGEALAWEGRDADLGDVRGQDAVIEALAVAAVGSHHLLLKGEPGVGKTMLASRLASILPDLQPEDALTATALQSLAGVEGSSKLISRPPSQTPHHSATLVSLIGGGNPIRPGAVSLAHSGVLLLDEARDGKCTSLNKEEAHEHITTPARRQCSSRPYRPIDGLSGLHADRS